MAGIEAFPLAEILSLHAARKGYLRYLKYLIEAGVDIETQDMEGQALNSLNTVSTETTFTN